MYNSENGIVQVIIDDCVTRYVLRLGFSVTCVVVVSPRGPGYGGTKKAYTSWPGSSVAIVTGSSRGHPVCSDTIDRTIRISSNHGLSGQYPGNSTACRVAVLSVCGL